MIIYSTMILGLVGLPVREALDKLTNLTAFGSAISFAYGYFRPTEIQLHHPAKLLFQRGSGR
jgi:hypothetical protein